MTYIYSLSTRESKYFISYSARLTKLINPAKMLRNRLQTYINWQRVWSDSPRIDHFVISSIRPISMTIDRINSTSETLYNDKFRSFKISPTEYCLGGMNALWYWHKIAHVRRRKERFFQGSREFAITSKSSIYLLWLESGSQITRLILLTYQRF